MFCQRRCPMSFVSLVMEMLLMTKCYLIMLTLALKDTKKKEAGTQSHIPRVIIDCRTDTDSHRKKWHITLVGSA